jgi:hypothetical protein
MDKETQRLLSLALYYVEASLEDMKWQYPNTGLDSFNMGTNGTQSFDTTEELEQYLATMQDYVNELKGVVK